MILDLFTVKFLISYSSKPIYLFGGFGIVMMAISFITLLLLLIRRQVYGIGMSQSPFFLVGTTLMIMGFQSILMGLIAELLARTYHESQQKPTYFVRRVITHAKAESQE